MRRILITGGGTGIGRSIAHQFAANGDAVTIAGRREAPLADTAKGTDIEIKLADVTKEEDVAVLFETPFDVVIANAGAGYPNKIKHISLDEWNATLAVNLTGTFLTFREALKGMEPGGRLIAIASTASLQGGASIPSYSAAKHGVLGLVRSVAQDVARSGTTCNAICPGFVDTEMAETAIKGVMDRFHVDQDAATDMIVSRNPMRRLITPDEVASTAFFLASAEASAINGHALSVSGGEI